MSHDAAFDSAWLSWYWAFTHAKRLQRDVERFTCDANLKPAISLRSEYHPQRHSFGVVIERIDPLPPAWALMVADFANSLKSSLDHVAWAVVERSGGSLTDKQARNVYFPICKTAVDFRNVAGRLPGCGRTDLARIRRYQPYRGGKKLLPSHSLCVLDAIVNECKHRTIKPLLMLPAAAKFQVTQHSDCVITGPVRISGALLLKPDAEIGRLPARKVGPNPDIKVKVDMTFEPCVNESSPVRLEDWLNESIRWTAAILQEFADPPQDASDLLSVWP